MRGVIRLNLKHGCWQHKRDNNRMSTITAGTGYEGQLWLDYDLEHRSFTFKWSKHTVIFGTYGINVTTEFDISDDEQIALIKCLAKRDPQFPPHWQTLTPDLHRLVERMTGQILEAAITADNCLRKIPKGLRLAPLEFTKHRTQAGQMFPVIRWQFSKKEQERFMPILETYGPDVAKAYNSGMVIPMPVHFERRQVSLTEEELNRVGNYLEQPSRPQPFRSLYAIALENFVNRSYDSAVLILATSIETALKWWLIENSDPIADYLLTNVQSPPIDKLYSCARKNTEISLPKHFNSWIVNLRDARNDVAHKPLGKEISSLEIARWFAIGEAIFSAFEGYSIDPLTGSVVEPIGEKANEKFPPDSRGIVLRREILYREDSYHIVLDTGETSRFSEKTFKKSENQSIQS